MGEIVISYSNTWAFKYTYEYLFLLFEKMEQQACHTSALS